MRLWSLDPQYLDRQGLLAVWREAKLAQKVLQNKTKGYKNHPQLERFKNTSRPVNYINAYLLTIWQESQNRGYNFSKLRNIRPVKRIETTKDQLDYEFNHLLTKLKIRDKKRYQELKNLKKIKANSLFRIVKGKIASWERIK